MRFNVQVDECSFQINVGQGYNDFAWLALLVAKLYSQRKNPDSNYLPCNLVYVKPNGDSFKPHPRTKIYELLDEKESKEIVIQIEIRKGQIPMNEEQERWFDEAFGKMRNQFKAEFTLIPKLSNQNLKLKSESVYVITYEYKMFPEVMYEFDPKNYPIRDRIFFKETITPGGKIYTAELILPLGQLTYKYEQQNKNDKDSSEPPTYAPIDPKDFQVQKSLLQPTPISQQEIQKKIMDHALQQEQLVEQLKQQEKDNLKDKQPTQLCPYKFQKLWVIIENNADGNTKLTDLEDNLYNKISQFMEQRLPQLYEVFYQYTLLYNQDIEKKDEISIPFQDVMHFLKFYGLVQDSSMLFSFVEIYDPDGIKSADPKNSLQLAVKFPEFVCIIIKLSQFRKTNNLVDVESQDQLIKQIVDKIIQIHLDETEFNHFQIHMKFNEALINFLRENQEQLQKIFINRLNQGNDGSQDVKCHIRREEIKQLIQDSGYKGDNLDIIIDTGYKELFNDEKYQGFEGLFYYEFLQVMQWLALVLIQNDEKPQQEEDEVGSLEELQEKLLYFIKCIEI